MMKVEVWVDIVCPWCYLGERRLVRALSRFEHGSEVDVRWRSFELDPHGPRVEELPPVERLQRKYGWTAEQVRDSWARLRALGALEGIEFRFDEARRGNSFDAHRLLQLARERSRQNAVLERFLRGYFTEAEPVGEPAALAGLAVAAGLDESEVRTVLDGDAYADAVRADEREAFRLGVTGVPFYVVGGRYAISGAQSVELIQACLERAWRERAEAA